MPVITLLLCLLWGTLLAPEAFSRQQVFTLEEKNLLKSTSHISLHTIALTEKGLQDPQNIQRVVAKRFHQMGYTIVENGKDSHDVVVKVKCEERKTRIGPSKYGGDADSLYSPSRIWKGPACQITYGLNGHQSTWRKEVRTEFENAIKAAQKVKVRNAGQFALTSLIKQLEQDDFPIQLTAEWGQATRLITLMKNSETEQHLKLSIIPLLGQISDPSALTVLKEVLADPMLAPEAALALGHQGNQATETLLELLATTQVQALKIAAVKGLGEIATNNIKAPVFTPLVTSLHQPNTAIPVQTEIVKALGKLADQRAVPVLEELNQTAWTDPSNSSDMQQLRAALTWSLWQLNPDAHAGE